MMMDGMMGGMMGGMMLVWSGSFWRCLSSESYCWFACS